MENPKQAEWGKCHPTQNHDAKRVPWSKAELNYLSQWIRTNNSTSASLCLKTILKDTKCFDIFHVNHILNSSRLRTGLSNVLK